MKIRNLIMSLLAVAALAATGCREEEQDLGLPEVKVGTTQLSFDAGIGTNTVTVNTTRDWKAVATVDWIDVSPKSGVGYENAVLTISVLENEGYNRTGSVRVDIGYDYKTILVHQEGPLGEKTEGTGTLEDPFTPAGAAEAASALAADEEAGPYYIKGIITTISTTFEASGTYGNASFFISEDGTENTKSFQVYQTYYLGNKKWTSSLGPDVKVGDEVIICGKITNFKGNTPETVAKGGSYIYSLNGETAGDDPTPQPGDYKSVTVAEFLAAAESQTQVYELVGTIGGSINTTYGNFDLTDETGTVYVYGMTATNLGYGEKNDKSYASLGLKEGDKIRVRGYRGSYTNQNTGEKKDELVYSWFIEKVDDGGQGGGGDYKSVTVAEFLAAAESQTQVYELVGTIGGSINTTYGNFDLTDETGTVYVYGMTATNLGYGEKNDKSYASLGLKEGDKIRVRGYRGSYTNQNTGEKKDELVYSWFIEKVDDGGQGGGGDDTPTGGTVSFDTNASAQTWSAETDGTYGAGFSSTTQGIKIGYYKHTGNTDAVAPKDDHVRYYKNCAIVVTAPQGKKFKSIKFIAPTANNCVGMNILEGDGTCNADTATLTMSWTGSASKVVFHAVNGQVRSKSITVEFE